MRLTQTQLIVAVMAAVTVVVLGGGYLLLNSTGVLSAPAAKPSASPSPSASPTPSPTPSPSKSSASPTPKPVVTTSPPGPPPAPRPCRTEGTNAPKDKVRQALEAAAARRFWTESQVEIPASLIKAVAYHESGWQSAAVSCDGAFGVMQIMPRTQDWMNQRFGIDPPLDRKNLQDNAMLGSAYLQWLVKYFDDNYFKKGDYTLHTCSTSKEGCLLNAVISAYHAGHDTVLTALKNGKPFPNPDYIANVRHWLKHPIPA